jgi:predicted amidohydrolase YtcJ
MDASAGTVRKSSSLKIILCIGILAASASAQSADTILINGKILSADARFSTYAAAAIRDGKLAALGTSPEIRTRAGKQTRVIDLGGRTVIPGLIDSHMHAIRAALSFATEVNWIGARSLKDALGRITEAARVMQPGSWLIVAGGWNVDQFQEKRRPTQADLIAAAPNNPVYVQLAYGWVMMTPAGYQALHIANESDLPNNGKFEKDPSGKPTGAVTGSQSAISGLFDKLPKPTFEQQVDGTRKFFRELNRLGMTGVVDPMGNNMSPREYEALFKVWRDRQLTVRVAYSLSPWAGFKELQGAIQMLPMGFGDDMLHFNGLGESITAGMYNNDHPSEADKQEYYEIVKWAAEHGLAVTQHWGRDASVKELLSVFERVDKDVPIAPLRWSIAHLNDASVETLRRMKALGVGWTVQDALYFSGEQFRRQEGEAAARRTPPVETARELGVAVGGGTDAHRVASYNPFTSLEWFLDGKTVTGVALRGPEETPSRENALRYYTSGSAWFSHDEDKRGSLEAGKLADLAVLSKDYLTVPLDQVGGIESLLTMVGGRIVYAAGPFAGLVP